MDPCFKKLSFLEGLINLRASKPKKVSLKLFNFKIIIHRRVQYEFQDGNKTIRIYIRAANIV
jgi:hypothetical protein